MSDKKIKVPDGMLKAAKSVGTTGWDNGYLPYALEASLRWLTEHPIVPTDEEIEAITSGKPMSVLKWVRFAIIEWQRRMFDAPEPELAIKDLLWKANPYPNTGAEYRHDEAVQEAYRRGKEEAKSNG